jgi:hypothetical protein
MLSSTVEIMTNMVKGSLLVRIQVNILLRIGNDNAGGIKFRLLFVPQSPLAATSNPHLSQMARRPTQRCCLPIAGQKRGRVDRVDVPTPE